ncbi:hypothetical protein ABW19_dt0208496 [Dactylella cylindrospora]|nr:hypothetical protein ABW19_dt0208496 [Dactylella cylindrospora]
MVTSYGLFEKKAGELVWLKDSVTINLERIVRLRELVLTNHIDLTCGGIFPREDALAGEDVGRLICRRRAIIADDAENDLQSAKRLLGESGLIRMLQKSEADEGFA